MKRWWYLVALGAVAVMILLAVSTWRNPPASAPRPAAMRIVSLAPSITEILFALGLGDSVVGATEYCTYPPEAQKIPRVGGFTTPNIEKILALSPDLVIGNEGAPAAVRTTIERSRARVLELRRIQSFQDMFDVVLGIGAATGTAEKARLLVAQIKADIESAAAPCRGIPVEKRPRVFVEIWYDPMRTVGRRSFIDELIVRAGGVNVAHEIDRDYPEISPEKVIEWNPDVIVIAYMAQAGSVESLSKRIGWSNISAVRNGRVINDISGHVLKPGPRLAEGVKMLARRLYPDGAKEAK